MKRDPRTDPRPGDMVRVGDDRERHVISRPTPSTVAFWTVKKDDKRTLGSARLESWQRWCRQYQVTVEQTVEP